MLGTGIALGNDYGLSWDEGDNLTYGRDTLRAYLELTRPYAYYNELVGGVPGAFRNYELDYWATSYREAFAYLNDVAPLSAEVAVAGPWEENWIFARGDLIHWTSPQGWEATDRPDLALFPTRSNMDLYVWSEDPTIATVSVDGATLAVIRDLRGHENDTN